MWTTLPNRDRAPKRKVAELPISPCKNESPPLPSSSATSSSLLLSKSSSISSSSTSALSSLSSSCPWLAYQTSHIAVGKWIQVAYHVSPSLFLGELCVASQQLHMRKPSSVKDHSQLVTFQRRAKVLWWVPWKTILSPLAWDTMTFCWYGNRPPNQLFS